MPQVVQRPRVGRLRRRTQRPQVDLAVFAGREERSSVRAENEVRYPPIVGVEAQDFLTGECVREAHRAVAAGGCKPKTAGCECEGGETALEMDSLKLGNPFRWVDSRNAAGLGVR